MRMDPALEEEVDRVREALARVREGSQEYLGVPAEIGTGGFPALSPPPRGARWWFQPAPYRPLVVLIGLFTLSEPPYVLARSISRIDMERDPELLERVSSWLVENFETEKVEMGSDYDSVNVKAWFP